MTYDIAEMKAKVFLGNEGQKENNQRSKEEKKAIREVYVKKKKVKLQSFESQKDQGRLWRAVSRVLRTERSGGKVEGKSFFGLGLGQDLWRDVADNQCQKIESADVWTDFDQTLEKIKNNT